jgi:hypothetical protein
MSNSLSIRAMIALAMLASGVLGSAWGTDSDPIFGTWNLNVQKSTFGGMPAVTSEIRTYSPAPHGFTLKIKTVSAEGKETTTETTYDLDHKDHPSMGNPDFDSLAGTQIDANTAEFDLKKGGKLVGKIRRAVSNDGKTLMINYVLTKADGVQTSALTVFDKQ